MRDGELKADDRRPSGQERERSAALMAVLRAPAADELPPLPVTMLVAAHPDDETVGAGSRLSRLQQAWFVHITDGAPRTGADAARHGLTPPSYAQARQRELHAAFALCGIAADRIRNLGCPDQQASLRLTELATTLARMFAQQRIEAVLTHPYEGGHPDHDACAFCVHAAVALLRQRGEACPAIVEMGLYHLTAEGLRTGAFLPADDSDAHLATIHLTPAEQQHKRELLECFRTQQATLCLLPPGVERFRPAPRYDFRCPPHEGTLYYERHPWGMTGDRFRALAAAALSELGLEGAL